MAWRAPYRVLLGRLCCDRGRATEGGAIESHAVEGRAVNIFKLPPPACVDALDPIHDDYHGWIHDFLTGGRQWAARLPINKFDSPRPPPPDATHRFQPSRATTNGRCSM